MLNFHTPDLATHVKKHGVMKYFLVKLVTFLFNYKYAILVFRMLPFWQKNLKVFLCNIQVEGVYREINPLF
jgi:hypothetical protein